MYLMVGVHMLVQVLRNPSKTLKIVISISPQSSLYRCRPESLSIALPLEDTAHEHLQRTSVELCPGHCALPSSLPVQSEHLSQFVLSGGSRAVDLVAEDEDGAGAELLVCQQRVQLHLALAKPDKLNM